MVKEICMLILLFAFFGCITQEKVENNDSEQYTITHKDCEGCYTEESSKSINTIIVEDQKDSTTLNETLINVTDNKTEIIEEEEPIKNTTPDEEVADDTTENDIQKARCNGPSNYSNIYTSEKVTYDYRVYEDVCVRWDTVKKFYCQNDTLKEANLNCPPGYWCQYGACVEFSGSCTDSDGNDTSKFGYVDIVTSPFSSRRESDSCVDDMNLYEWVCKENEGVQLLLSCKSGFKCVDGRCVKSKCKETDEGLDPLVFGSTSNTMETENDKCIDDKTLREFYCFGDSIRYVDILCADECIDSSCKPKEGGGDVQG
ncbi:MAG: hypothetical protein QXF35_04405 [Candidatus Bilamarchaeaceae archaeon]